MKSKKCVRFLREGAWVIIGVTGVILTMYAAYRYGRADSLHQLLGIAKEEGKFDLTFHDPGMEGDTITISMADKT